jgi:pimeloyl-ACP methyl ester carboxylesterase
VVAQPPISAPTIVLQGGGDGVATPQARDDQARFFTSGYQRRIIPTIGHNVPQEAPSAFAAAILELIAA